MKKICKSIMHTIRNTKVTVTIKTPFIDFSFALSHA